MRYRIERECWNERTYNGHTDSPYWRISFNVYEIGLTDDGFFWSIINGIDANTKEVRLQLEIIISECKLPIPIIYNNK